MAVTKLSNLSVTSGRSYSSLLAGNPTYVASSYESIAVGSGTGSNFDITFSSIPSTFKHLQLRGVVKDVHTVSALIDNLTIRFNSDTASNYNWHNLNGNGTAAAANGAANTTFIDIKEGIPASHSTQANVMGVFIIDILDYASTTKNKTVRVFHGIDANTSSAEYTVAITSGTWRSTNAITSITIGNPFISFYTTSTSIALYGIKESA